METQPRTPRPDLRIARSRAGLTQADLAAKLGCEQSTVSRYETGTTEVTKEMAPGIAAALNLSVLAVLYPAKPAKRAA